MAKDDDKDKDKPGDKPAGEKPMVPPKPKPPKEEDEEEKEYIVREGRTFGLGKLAAGESVWLTERQYKAFADLVEPRVKPRKGEEEEDPKFADTRDTAKNEQNIGVKTADKGTIRDAGYKPPK